MELPREVRGLFSSIRIGELTGKRRMLANEIIGEFSEEHEISLSNRDSLLSLVKLSKKLDNRKKSDKKLMEKMGDLITMCKGLKHKQISEKEAEKTGALAEAKRETRKQAELKGRSTMPSENILKTVRCISITMKTENYREEMGKGYEVLKKRIHEKELEPLEAMEHSLKNHKGYFFIVAEKEGKTVGACSGVALSYGDTSIFFVHYIAVAKTHNRMGIGTELLDGIRREADAYLVKNKKPPLTNLFIETSKPSGELDEAKVWFFARKGNAGSVATANGKYLKIYEQPDLEGGNESVPMMAMISRIGQETETRITKKNYWEILECVYGAYKRMDVGVDNDHVDDLRARAFERITGVDLDKKQLSDKKAVEKIFVEQAGQDFALIKEPLIIFRGKYEPENILL